MAPRGRRPEQPVTCGAGRRPRRELGLCLWGPRARPFPVSGGIPEEPLSSQPFPPCPRCRPRRRAASRSPVSPRRRWPPASPRTPRAWTTRTSRAPRTCPRRSSTSLGPPITAPRRCASAAPQKRRSTMSGMRKLPGPCPRTSSWMGSWPPPRLRPPTEGEAAACRPGAWRGRSPRPWRRPPLRCLPRARVVQLHLSPPPLVVPVSA